MNTEIFLFFNENLWAWRGNDRIYLSIYLSIYLKRGLNKLDI